MLTNPQYTYHFEEISTIFPSIEVQSRLQTLGGEGWELVCIYKKDQTTKVAVFKKLIPSYYFNSFPSKAP